MVESHIYQHHLYFVTVLLLLQEESVTKLGDVGGVGRVILNAIFY